MWVHSTTDQGRFNTQIFTLIYFHYFITSFFKFNTKKTFEEYYLLGNDTLCLVEVYRRFGGNCFFHIQGRRVIQGNSEQWNFDSFSLHGVISYQIIFILRNHLSVYVIQYMNYTLYVSLFKYLNDDRGS
jgi:hypothetical protein